MTSNEKLAKVVDPLLEVRTNDWRELAVVADLSPRELAETGNLFEGADNRIQFKNLLNVYKTEILAHIDSAIDGRKDYLDRNVQLEIYWNSPVFPRGSL